MADKSKTSKIIEDSTRSLNAFMGKTEQTRKAVANLTKELEAMSKVARGSNRKALKSLTDQADSFMKGISRTQKIAQKQASGGPFSSSWGKFFEKEAQSVERAGPKLQKSMENTLSKIANTTQSSKLKGFSRDVKGTLGKMNLANFKMPALGGTNAAGLLGLLGRLAPLASAASGALLGLAAGAGLVVGAFGTMAAAMVPIINMMMTVESQIIRLKSAMQDGVSAVNEFQKAVKFAGTTPFAVTDVTESLAGLRAFQFDPFKEVTESGRNLLDVLGDMAGAMGTDLATASWALQRAMVGEWEIMQNNFQISARMIPELKGLTSGTQEYGEAIVKFLSKQQRFVNGMEEARNSIRGLMSNITDAPKNFLIGIGSVDLNRTLLKNVTLYGSVVDSLRKIYDSVSAGNSFEQFQANVAVIEAGSKKAKKAYEDMGAGLLSYADIKAMQRSEGGFTEAEMKAFESMSKSKLTANDFASMKNKTEAGRQTAMLEKGIPVTEAVSRIEVIMHLGRALGQVFRVAWDVFIAPVFDAIAKGIDYTLGSMMDWIGKLTVPLKNLGSTTDETLTQVVDRVVAELGVSAQAYSQGLATLSERTNKMIREEGVKALTPLKKQLLIFTILMEFFKLYLESKLEFIWKLFGKVFGFIGDLIGALAKNIGEGFMDAFKALNIGDDLNFLKETFVKLGNAVMKFIDGPGQILILALKVIGRVVGGIVVVAFKSLLNIYKNMISVITGMVEGFNYVWEAMGGSRMLEGVTAAFEDLWSALMEIFSIFGEVSGGGNIVTKIFAALGKVVGFLAGTVVVKFIAVLRGAINILSGAVDIIMGIVNLDFERVADGFIHIFGTIIQGILDLFGIDADFLGWLEGLWAKFKDIASKGMDGIIGAIDSKMSQVFSFFGGDWGAFKSGLMDALNAASKWWDNFSRDLQIGWLKAKALFSDEAERELNKLLQEKYKAEGKKGVSEVFTNILTQNVNKANKPKANKPKNSDFYGSMFTREGPTYMHRGEMIIPEKFASMIRRQVGVDTQPGGTGSFEQGLKRATSRPEMPQFNIASKTPSPIQNKSINVTNHITVKGNLDKKAADDMRREQLADLRNFVLGV